MTPQTPHMKSQTHNLRKTATEEPALELVSLITNGGKSTYLVFQFISESFLFCCILCHKEAYVIVCQDIQGWSYLHVFVFFFVFFFCFIYLFIYSESDSIYTFHDKFRCACSACDSLVGWFPFFPHLCVAPAFCFPLIWWTWGHHAGEQMDLVIYGWNICLQRIPAYSEVRILSQTAHLQLHFTDHVEASMIHGSLLRLAQLLNVSRLAIWNLRALPSRR